MYLGLDVGKNHARYKEEEQSRCIGQEGFKRWWNVIAGWNQLGPMLTSDDDNAARLEVYGVVTVVGPAKWNGGRRRVK